MKKMSLVFAGLLALVMTAPAQAASTPSEKDVIDSLIQPVGGGFCCFRMR